MRKWPRIVVGSVDRDKVTALGAWTGIGLKLEAPAEGAAAKVIRRSGPGETVQDLGPTRPYGGPTWQNGGGFDRKASAGGADLLE